MKWKYFWFITQCVGILVTQWYFKQNTKFYTSAFLKCMQLANPHANHLHTHLKASNNYKCILIIIPFFLLSCSVPFCLFLYICPSLFYQMLCSILLRTIV
jgi:hypothetical protein